MTEVGEETLNYQESLMQVRRLPQKSEAEKQAKHEAARDLRIETTLSWASFAKDAVDALVANPSLTFKDLKKIVLSHKTSLSHPQLAERFIGSLEAARVKTNEALNYFRKQAGLRPLVDNTNEGGWSQYEKEEVGERIFRSITNKRPSGKIDMLFTPIAVIIKPTNGDDFNKLDERENVAGFYKNGQVITEERRFFFTKTEYSKGSYPLIVVSSTEPRLLQHEIGHGINRAIIDTLAVNHNEFDTRTVWGGSIEAPEPANTLNTRKAIDKIFEERMLPYALAKAKDELIADYFATHDFNHVLNLEKEWWVYDYFNNRLGEWFRDNKIGLVDEGKAIEIKSKIWSKYSSIISDAARSAQFLEDNYKREGMTKRRSLLPFVLAQVPLKDWPSRILVIKGEEKVVGGLEDFKGEIRDFRDVYAQAEDMLPVYPTAARFSPNSPAKTLMSVMEDVLKKRSKVFTGSIYPIIREMSQGLDQFVQATGYTTRGVPSPSKSK